MRALFWFIILAGCIPAGCASDPGTGSVVGSLIIPQCDGSASRSYTCADDTAQCEAFRLDIDFLSMELFGERAVIRLQHGAQPLAESDGLHIDVPRVDAVTLGEPMPLMGRRAPGTPAGTADEGLRAGLSVGRRCPDNAQSFALVGAVTFQAFGTEVGDRIAGAFGPLRVHDGRDPAAAPLGTIRGTFDFTVRAGGLHQRFAQF